MILGPLRLPVIAVNGMSVDQAWNYASHAVIEGKTRKQFVAVDGKGLSLSLYLHAEHIDPRATIDRLELMGDVHDVHVLQELDGTIWGEFVIESMSVKPIFKLRDGFLVCASVELKLSDPGLDDGVVTVPTPVAVVGTKTPTTSVPPGEDTAPGIDTVTPQSIARR